MKAKPNNGKIKFPVEIKGELESENFESQVVKRKISSEITEVVSVKNKKKKCQSNSLM